MLKKIHKKEKFITPVSLIKNSKLKHNCIHKGKCPHRGYDLSNEIPNENGIITCPLHGLQFDKITKKLLTNN
jgi:nitrite reductase/ring-hydroxylating ferredoxin subunit